MPRFCLVCTYPPSEDAIAPLARDLAEELSKQAEVVFLAPKNGTNDISDHPVGIRLLRCWTPSFYPLQVLKAALQERANALHIQQEFFLYGQRTGSASLFPVLLILLRIARRPFVVTVHHVIPLQLVPKLGATVGVRFPLVAKMFLIFYYRALGIASTIIVPRNDQRMILVHDYHLEASKVCVIPHAVKPGGRISTITSAEARGHLGISADFVVLFFGFIRPTKGLDVLLRAVAFVRSKGLDVILLVVGKSQQRYFAYLKRIQEMVLELNLSRYVSFAGYVPEERLQQFFDAADVVVFPYTEAGIESSAAFLKATESGRPIIATTVGEFPQLKEDVPYYELVPPSDPTRLAEAIENTLMDHRMATRTPDGVQALLAKRSIEHQAKEYVQLYLRASSKRP